MKQVHFRFFFSLYDRFDLVRLSSGYREEELGHEKALFITTEDKRDGRPTLLHFDQREVGKYSRNSHKRLPTHFTESVLKGERFYEHNKI